MKLIDLLVKKTNEEGWKWPAEANAAIAIKDGSDYVFYRSGELLVNCNTHWIKASGEHDVWVKKQSPFLDSLWGKKSDVVLKSQYESALAASEGWIGWGGGECPVLANARVDVKQRDNWVSENSNANGWQWRHDGSYTDIIAYRLHNPDINLRANDDRLEQDLNECIGQDVGQEWNGEGLPPVGTECETLSQEGIWYHIKIVYSDGVRKMAWSEMCDEYQNIDSTNKAQFLKFRQLRTEAERAMESAKHIIAELCRDSASNGHSADLIMEAIAAGKIPGVKLENK